MQSLCICLSLLAALPLAATASGSPTPAVIPARIQSSAQQFIRTQTTPAMVIAMIDHGHSTITGYGKLADGNAPSANTVFEIGSVTKTFTALLLAQQVQRGNLSLDTPLAQLMPDARIPSHAGKLITLGVLAEQASGLPRLPDNLQPQSMQDPYVNYGAAKLKAFLASEKLSRDPGEKYVYSNLGVGLLGYALGHHAGSNYASLLEHVILQPLGMTSTATTLTPNLQQRLAPGHDSSGAKAPHWHWLDALAGAGAILSDAHDMLIYLRANIGTGTDSLAAAMALAHKPQRKINDVTRIGLVWMTTQTPDGDIIWHNGETGGYASFIGFSANGKRGIVLLANRQSAVNDLTKLGFAALSPQLPLPKLDKPDTTPHQAITLADARLDEYVGTYTLTHGISLRVTRKKHQLFAQATGQNAFPLNASASDHFFYDKAGIQIEFKRNDKGVVDELILHQQGHSMRAQRQP